MEGSQQCIEDFKTELLFRRDMFYKGLQEAAPGVFSGTPPDGAFYAFVKINAECGEERRHHGRLAVVGDGGVPDQARAHRLRAGRGLRRRAAKATSASAPAARAKSLPARWRR